MRGFRKDKAHHVEDVDMEEKKADDHVLVLIDSAKIHHRSNDRGGLEEQKEVEEEVYHDNNDNDAENDEDIQQLAVREEERPKSHATSPMNHMTKTVTQVIQDLLCASSSRHEDSDGPAANAALRQLFALTEHDKENRIALVHANDGQLVSVLLHFLQENCKNNNMNNITSSMSDVKSSNNNHHVHASPKSAAASPTAAVSPIGNSSAEQYLTLLVLNNLCTAPENKRVIALDHDGAKILASLLVDDPSCHLLAIILVNLTFADASLRLDLMISKNENNNNNLHLVESLAFCLRVASWTSDEYEARRPVLLLENSNITSNNNNNNDPSGAGTAAPPPPLVDLLQVLLQQDSPSNDVVFGTAAPSPQWHETLPENPLFPDTARYCLLALKNLTRCVGRATCIAHVPHHHPYHSTATSTATPIMVANHHTTTRNNMNDTTLTTAIENNDGDTAASAATTCTTRTPVPLPMTAAQVLIRTGIVPHILRYITIADEAAISKSMCETKNEPDPRTTTTFVKKSRNAMELEEIGRCNFTDIHVVPVAAAAENAPREKITAETPQTISSSPTDSLERPSSLAGAIRTGKNSSVTIMTEREEYYSRISNSPSTWDANSAADAALFCILNLAADPSAREYLREIDTVKILTWITICGEDNITTRQNESMGVDATTLLDFQCMKAHIALAYLVGSEGHFGQPNILRSIEGGLVTALPNESVSPRNGPFMTPNTQDTACLLLSAREPLVFVELLANTIHGRGKTGPGGYSPATISTKFVLYAIRCLLTQHFNQTLFALKSGSLGVKLNILLMKVLAWHAVTTSTKTVIGDCPDDIDAETVEYAVFSLYLMSNHGVKSVFLPAWFGHDEVTTKSLAAKILTSYASTQKETSPGKHAVEQLLLRLPYLSFGESSSSAGDEPFIGNKNVAAAGARLVESDYSFSNDVLNAITLIRVPKTKKKSGAYPRPDIFDRPILRTRVLRTSSQRSPWDNSDSVDYFPSVLVAVHELSFQSSKVRHLDAIDEFQIANNISNSANGEKTESYNQMWSWEDTATEIQRNLDRVRSSESHVSSANSSRNGNGAVVDLSSLFVCGDLSAVV